MRPKVHLITQRGQPYGSVRMCCERCGAAGPPYDRKLIYVTDEESYRRVGLFRCDELSDKPPDAEAQRALCRTIARVFILKEMIQ